MTTHQPGLSALTAGFERHTLAVKPSRPGVYVRISLDRSGTEKGITRQIADAKAKMEREGWGADVRIYDENDTSAFRKKRVVLPDGSIVYRVIRPVYRQALRDLQDGVIDGLLVYDLDRLARETRDLDDLIDIVKATGRPVKGVTSEIDLLTSDGQLTARVLVSAAQKSSQDTSRRVARAAAAQAAAGEQRLSRRAFGWRANNVDLDPEESAVARAVIELVASGGGLHDAWRLMEASGLRTSAGNPWTVQTVRQYIRQGRAAGVRMYFGTGRSAKLNPEQWREAIVLDDEGQPQRGNWQPIVPYETWVRANERLDANKSGEPWRRRNLLTGTLRCGRCGSGMRVGRSSTNGAQVYVCKPKAAGGCGGSQRTKSMLDPWVEELLARWIASLDEMLVVEEPFEVDPRIAVLERRIEEIERRFIEGDPTLDERQYWVALPEMRRNVTALREAATKPKAVGSDIAHAQMLSIWTSPDATVAERIAVLQRYVEAIVVLPTTRRGRAKWNPDDEIKVIWRDV